MKQWGKITGCLFAMLLAFVSLQAQAATKAQDREFDHTHTGFPITGVHATTQCETCHVGGVFVGTPRACDGCHAVGKRVVATPKSLKHIVTDAPCETCHFNTSTFYGARFNHGTAVPGQCTNCHNGRIVEGTPRNHPVSPIAGASCDSCHRSSSWLPASWNHTNTAADCATCHNSTGGGGRNYTSARHSGAYTSLSILTPCRECHTNYYTFSSYYYRHNAPGDSPNCGTCHNVPAYANGVMQISTTAAHDVYSNPAKAGITQCQSCHKSYGVGSFPAGRYDHAGAGACDTCHKTPSYGPYIRQMSANHIPFTATTCTSCHYSSGSTWGIAVSGVTLHSYVNTTPCTTCHLTGNSYSGNGQQTKSVGHEGMGAGDDCSKSGCHKPLGSRGVLYQRWD